MKVIIVGLGKFGRKVLQLLTFEHHDIVAIDKDAEKIQNIVDRYDVLGLCGNGCNAENLQEAGAETADMLIAVTPSDEQNVLCSLIAKNLGVKTVLARVRDPEYNGQAEFMREKFGIDRFVNPEKAISEEITRILRFPAAERIYPFADGKVEIVEIKLPIGSVLAHKQLKDLNTQNKKFSVLIAAIERAGQIIIPNGSTMLEEGDIISLCGKHLDLVEFLKSYELLKRKGQYVMILGADRMTHYLAQNLVKFGFKVKVISPSQEKCTAISQATHSVSVICGDFADKEVLEAEGIADADAVVATSGYDENNIMISLFAKSKSVQKIVTMIRSESYLGIIGGLQLDTVLSPYEIVAEDAVRYLRSVPVDENSRIVALYKIAGERAEALQFDVNGHAKLTGKSLKELSADLKSDVLITAIIRENTFVVPKGDTIIEADDSVIIVSSPENKISSLNDVLK